MKIAEVKQTCCACPSQWEGRLTDGRTFYVRYRYGYLSVCVSPTSTTDMYAAVSGEEVYGEQLGDGLDGCIDFDTVLEKTPLAFPTGTELWDDED